MALISTSRCRKATAPRRRRSSPPGDGATRSRRSGARLFHPVPVEGRLLARLGLKSHLLIVQYVLPRRVSPVQSPARSSSTARTRGCAPKFSSNSVASGARAWLTGPTADDRHSPGVDRARSRVAVWNMERGGPGSGVVDRQLQLLDGIDFDLAIVTEPPAACSMTCDGVVAAPALRTGHAGPQAWVSVLGKDVQPVRPCPPFERLAVAAQARVGEQLVIVYGSVLPWRSAPAHVPSLALPGESAVPPDPQNAGSTVGGPPRSRRRCRRVGPASTIV